MESSNWQTKTIAELGNFSPTTVQTGPFGSQLHSDDYVEEGIPLILIRNIGDNGLTGDLPKITEEDAKRLARYALLPGDIVFSRVGRVGSCFLATEENRGWIISGQTLRIRFAYNEVDPNYLIYAIRNKETQDFISGSSVGSTRSSINTSILESLPVRLPPLKQQQKIAEVLATIDRAIAQTEALIAKHQRIKTGLMQDLLTRGIDEHGQLRDPSTHRFKSTPLGMIPEEWDVSTLDQKCERVTDGAHASFQKNEGEIPFLFVSCIRNGQIYWDQASTISEEVYEIISKGKEPKKGLVLYTIVGSYGYAAVVEDNRRFSFQRHIGYLLPKESELSPHFLATWLNSEYGKRLADLFAMGNAQKTIILRDLKIFPLPVPPKPEQEQINLILKNADLEIENLKEQHGKYQAIKAGLMQDLLSGRVSVKGLVEG